jgi:Flp pilus assembly protein TadD
VNILQKVLKLTDAKTDTNNEARNNLAVAYILIGSHFEALPILTKLHHKFRTDAAIASNLMFLLLCMGSYDKVVAMQDH